MGDNERGTASPQRARWSKLNLATQQDMNLEIYREPVVARHYAEMVSLFPAEQRAIETIAACCIGLPVMDLGCGGGRLTTALLSISGDYVGIDYSPEMISTCQTRFPHTRFEIGDARDLGAYPADHYGLVLFSFNGIDYLPHRDRIEALHQIRRVLRTNGIFLFSSHNIEFDRRDRQPAMRRLAGVVKDYIVDVRQGARPAYQLLRSRRRGYRAELLAASGKRLITYYIRFDEQLRQLQDTGFLCKSVYDSAGEMIEARATQRATSPWLYYLATKWDPAPPGNPAEAQRS